MVKLKNILVYIPGIQIPIFISEYISDMRELKEARDGYQSAVRQSHLFEISSLEGKRRIAHQSEIPLIDAELTHHSIEYAKALFR